MLYSSSPRRGAAYRLRPFVMSAARWLVAATVVPAVAFAAEVPVLFGTGDGSEGVFADSVLGHTATDNYERYEAASDVKAITCGTDSLYFIRNDGTLWGCGRNELGQLGDGTRVHRTTPVQIASDVASAAGGGAHLVFLKTDGTVWTVGADGIDGRFRTTPGQVGSGSVAVAAGDAHTLFLKADGTLWGCGSNFHGPLGPTASETQTTPVQLASDVASMDAGGMTSMWVGTDGSLWGVGYNNSGQLGDGSQTDRTVPVEIMASGAAKVVMGQWHSFVFKTDGSLWAAGYNLGGTLGIGSSGFTIKTHTFVANGMTHADGGFNHSLFRASNGVVYASGANFHGSMGISGIYDPKVPSPMDWDVTAVAAAGFYSAVLKADGRLLTFGRNQFGQLGQGEPACRTPRPISGYSGAASAQGSSAMYVRDDGSVHWVVDGTSRTLSANIGQVATGGSHDLMIAGSGQLGLIDRSGLFDPAVAYPVSVPGATSVVAAVSGVSHFAFIKQDGSLWAQGSNSYGQLGDGTTTTRNEPVMVAEGVAQVSAMNHTLYVKTDGTLWAAGWNNKGQLGNGSTTNASTPVQIATDVTWSAAGSGFSAFVKSDGTLWICGTASIDFAEGTGQSLTPVQLATDVVRAWAGGDHLLFLKTDDSLWAAGENAYGQLGDGTFTARRTPVKVAEKVIWAEAGSGKSLIKRLVATPEVVITPASPSVPSGGSTTLTAEASGEGAFVYQWYVGATGDASAPIDGATDNSYVTPALTAPTRYWVRVSNFAGDTDSAAVEVAIGFGISSQPMAGSVQAGGSLTLTVAAHGDPGEALSYQWYLDGVAIPQATLASYTLPSVQSFHAGSYTVVVTGAGRSASSIPTTLVVTPPPPSAARLMNLSTRALDLTGDNLMIPGFVIQGTGTKRMLIRGVGPGMAGVLPNTLADPHLQVMHGQTLVAQNDNWSASSDAQLIAETAHSVGAFPLSAGSADAAIVVELPAGAYTAPTRGVAEGTGIAMVELYDADPDSSTAELVNISNRGFVDVGDRIMIPGFVISDEGPRTVLIRAVGPGMLSQVDVAGVLPDPILTVYQGADAMFSNDDWGQNPDAATTKSVSQTVGAFPLEDGSTDAALVVTLSPGAYTVHVRGKGESTGIALVELYLVP